MWAGGDRRRCRVGADRCDAIDVTLVGSCPGAGVSGTLKRELSGPAVATDTYAATEVPYEDGQLSMLVIVPEYGHDQQAEDALSNELIAEIDAAATEGVVQLWLPKFESDSRLDLRQAFDGLGVDDVFGPGGSWDGIAPGISLASGVHAADISVDEDGTVAAAATALGFEDSGPPQPDVTVRADKPSSTSSATNPPGRCSASDESPTRPHSHPVPVGLVVVMVAMLGSVCADAAEPLVQRQWTSTEGGVVPSEIVACA